MEEAVDSSVHVKDLESGEIFRVKRKVTYCDEVKDIMYDIEHVDWEHSAMPQPALECTGFGTYDMRLQTEIVRAYTPLLPFYLPDQPNDQIKWTAPFVFDGNVDSLSYLSDPRPPLLISFHGFTHHDQVRILSTSFSPNPTYDYFNSSSTNILTEQSNEILFTLEPNSSTTITLQRHQLHTYHITWKHIETESVPIEEGIELVVELDNRIMSKVTMEFVTLEGVSRFINGRGL